MLEIPERMGLTDFPWCDFIQMEYYVHAVARTHSFYDDIVVKLPIIINAKVIQPLRVIKKFSIAGTFQYGMIIFLQTRKRTEREREQKDKATAG